MRSLPWLRGDSRLRLEAADHRPVRAEGELYLHRCGKVKGWDLVVGWLFVALFERIGQIGHISRICPMCPIYAAGPSLPLS